MHPKNKTRFKTLDKLAADHRIEEVWDEGDDGLWANLIPGYNVEGCSGIHAETCKGLLEEARLIEAGEPY